MKLNSLPLLILLLVWIPVVGLLFAIIPDKKVASVIAGSGFLLLPILILTSEFTKAQKNMSVVILTFMFFLFSALPIFLLRVLNWNYEFKELSLLGIPADILHRASNVLYLLMVIAVGIAFYRERKAKSYQK